MWKKDECGGCGKVFPYRLFGLSRKDNSTTLCPDCEQDEAMKEAEAQGLI